MSLYRIRSQYTGYSNYKTVLLCFVWIWRLQCDITCNETTLAYFRK